MKKIFLASTALMVMGTGLSFNQTAEAATRPIDIGNLTQGSQDILNELYDKDLLEGYADGSFQPFKEVTRSEFVAMLIRVLGLKSNGDNFNFADTNYLEWNHEVMNIAFQYGLLDGSGMDKYDRPVMKPNEPLTRLEMMLILVRAHKMLNEKPELNTEGVEQALRVFTDSTKLPEWAKSDVAYAVEYGITVGVSPTKLGHETVGKRLQTAAFAHRLLKDYEETGEIIGLPDHKGDRTRAAEREEIEAGYFAVGEPPVEEEPLTHAIIYYPSGQVFGEMLMTTETGRATGSLYAESGVRTYVGDMNGFSKHGNGIETGENGEYEYRGEFWRDKYEGEGEYYKDGKLVYEGGFEWGRYHGDGKHYADGKLVYEGRFAEDEYHGFGQLYENGNLRYDGAFYHDKFHGYGTLYNKDGEIEYAGEFSRGKIAKERVSW